MITMSKHNPLTPTYVCPRCGAHTLEGHDDDMQIYCAACGLSFLMKSAEEVMLSQEDIDTKFERVRRDSGWIAYVKRKGV